MAAVIELRAAYNGPNGYESERPEFRSGAFDAWRVAFIGQNRTPAEMVSELAATLDSNLDQNTLQSQMEAFYSQNQSRFLDWLRQIGVNSGSPLEKDIQNAQALFAISMAARQNPDLNTFSSFTWISPFCGGVS